MEALKKEAAHARSEYAWVLRVKERSGAASMQEFLAGVILERVEREDKPDVEV